MPQVFALMIVGAGIYAGYKWISRALSDAQEALKRGEADAKRREAMARGGPKDLGTLDYDPQTGVYKPRAK